MRFHMASGVHQWFIFGYIAPEDVSMIEGVVTEFGRIPRGTAVMVAGNINSNLEDPEGSHRE